MKKQGFLFCSDLHLRATTPRARIDEFETSMWSKVEEILDFADEEHLTPVIAGDIFEVPKSPYWITNRLMHLIGNREVYATAGQHDLPNHLWANLEQSALGNMQAAGFFKGMIGSHYLQEQDTALHFYPWGSTLGSLPEDYKSQAKYHVAICHQLTYQGTTNMKGASKASSMLRKMAGFDLVVIGDNHKAFIEEDDGRYLISPGSMMRSSADQMDHVPGFWLWEPGEEPERCEFDCMLPAEEVLTREHIEKDKERKDRLDSFVATVNTEYALEICFESNLQEHLAANEVSKDVRTIIQECVEGDDQ